ncbi:hypothetical protein PPERSA_00549 [Pseudocohnilembus persalinus]|uniref:G-protein coupled receptors family 2 profile 2 domain-containing protein n=1 Tax=Pseudocohnilembus persalinus TaxID=266149 RepID=A0A0V0QTB9_PSEPJ|nr:hypothetical protein PPERSA_00549 [Pseudocohnilembus persalinus]|eukprot:KRX05248.1 hypothetical protein PPERSA_00549 [Pseudocohnilembus persalinus]
MEYINNVFKLLQPIQGNLQNGQQVNKIHRRILRDTLSINEEYLIILDLISNSMSILGILFIWVVYFKYRKELNSPSYKMILFLQTTDFLFSVSQIMNFDYVDGEQNKVLCYMQGFLSTYAGLGSILWTMAISFTMKSALLSDTTNLLKNQKISTYICYGVPLLMSLIPVITDDYGPAGVICWIDDTQNPTRVLILRMLTFYGPLWIAITYNFYTYITLIRYLKTVVDQESDQLQFVKNLMYYPFILVICWIFGTFNRIYVFFDDEIEIVSALHLFFGGLMGFFNALVYGFSGQAKKIIKDKCCSIDRIKYAI